MTKNQKRWLRKELRMLRKGRKPGEKFMRPGQYWHLERGERVDFLWVRGPGETWDWIVCIYNHETDSPGHSRTQAQMRDYALYRDEF